MLVGPPEDRVVGTEPLGADRSVVDEQRRADGRYEFRYSADLPFDVVARNRRFADVVDQRTVEPQLEAARRVTGRADEAFDLKPSPKGNDRRRASEVVAGAVVVEDHPHHAAALCVHITT